MRQFILSVVLGTVVAIGLWFSLGGTPVTEAGILTGTRPSNLGVSAGRLAPCPATPNCVGSQDLDLAHRIAAIPYSGSAEQAISTLKQAINALPRTKILSETENYLYVEFTSNLLGFVDDVELYADGAGAIQVRSASRLGESDLGVNAKRLESLRLALSGQ
jgi:uncharacterized protein (DUF1499 family)